MNKTILVSLGPYDRIEELIPCVEKVARPGEKVVFLMRYPVGGIRWQKEQFGMRAALKARELVDYYSWQGSVEKSQQQVGAACEARRVKGILAVVEVYAGSLRKAVRTQALNGDVHFVLTRAGIGGWFARLVAGTGSVFKGFRRPSFPPVMVINPRALV